ncbi:5-oxoprolinase subunit B/C family protein [Oerskovia enterophila]|uniref:Kinase A inhibitor n=1 Tax=Oerskovia enterophila TaxID=43678 RepID=A0ABX2Y332_9CELL|nr:urea amidolyase family protein [Oerskovia enterophila]OCI30501.1 kinase A inhibitor [Oerskovia enterophila]
MSRPTGAGGSRLGGTPADRAGETATNGATTSGTTDGTSRLPVRPYGDRALMVDLPGLDEVHALAAALRARHVEGVADVVPAARTVLVLLDDAATTADLGRVEGEVRAAWAAVARRADGGAGVASHAGAPGGVAPGEDVGPGEAAVVEIPVVYDGDDLPDVAAWAGLSVAEVVARHTGREYVVAFGGFMPGFGYLSQVDPAIAAPRLATPRTRVPAGSVALAGDLTAVYPRATPGGWRLLGRTDVELFDVDRDPPALLTAGTRVRFRAVERLHDDEPGAASEGDGIRVGGDDGDDGDGLVRGRDHLGVGVVRAGAGGLGRSLQDAPVHGSPGAAERTAPVGHHEPRGVEVLAPGLLTLIEDGGRPGWSAAGVGRSGAADRGALRLVNRLLANDESAAVLEVTLGGLAVRFHERATFALAGAPAPATLDGTPVGMQALLRARPGSVLRLGFPVRGTRTYVGVRGGFAASAVLGSRSYDVLAELGPAPLRAGDLVAIGPRPSALPVVDLVPVGLVPSATSDVGVALEVRAGLRSDWFGGDAWAALLAGEFEVSNASNRVGLRLSGPTIHRRGGELPSEGLVPGAIQVPPDGNPVLFLRDHPVTGGYPVIAVVAADALDTAAQLRPGDKVSFRSARSAPSGP